MRVTVGITTYNRPEYLRVCLDSLYKNDVELQVIVYDNGSDQETYDALDGYSNIDIYYREPLNTFDKSSIDFFVEHSIGDFILFLADDDFLSPHAIDYLVDAVGESDWCFCNANLVNQNGDVTDVTDYSGHPTEPSAVIDSAREMAMGGGGMCPIPFVFSIFRTSFLVNNELRTLDVPNNKNTVGDAVTCVHWMMSNPRVVFCEKPLWNYRRWPGASSLEDDYLDRERAAHREVRELFGWNESNRSDINTSGVL
jgi:glycosyltransferase involved in cell wall biosynthesis